MTTSKKLNSRCPAPLRCYARYTYVVKVVKCSEVNNARAAAAGTHDSPIGREGGCFTTNSVIGILEDKRYSVHSSTLCSRHVHVSLPWSRVFSPTTTSYRVSRRSMPGIMLPHTVCTPLKGAANLPFHHRHRVPLAIVTSGINPGMTTKTSPSFVFQFLYDTWTAYFTW